MAEKVATKDWRARLLMARGRLREAWWMTTRASSENRAFGDVGPGFHAIRQLATPRYGDRCYERAAGDDIMPRTECGAGS